MDYDTEERIEDAIVTLLEDGVGDMRVHAAQDFDALQYPACLVHCGDWEPASEDAEWAPARMFPVQVELSVEKAEEVDTVGNTLATARERNRTARSEVYNVLAGMDLGDRLNDVGIDSVIFSHAQLESAPRSVEEKRLVTTFNLIVIATPQEV